MAILELREIHKSYFLGKEEFPVLHGINLTFERGDFVSLLGESGGGKSTLMNIIGGLDREYEGDVLIDGQAQKSKKEKDMDAYRRDTIGFVFQSFNLVSYLSVLDNILISLKMTDLSERERQERATELTKQVGLYEHRKKKPAQLSGGQKQRVAIARALASDPEIILADEPTGALDSENTHEVLTMLQEIAKSGKTVIVVTHSQEVAEAGTRIIRLADGKIVGDERIRPAYKIEEKAKSFETKSLGIGDIIRTAFKHFTNTWKINLLIALGTAIGLFSVIFFLGLGAGGTKYMNDQVTSIANPDVIAVARRDTDNQGKNNQQAFSMATQNMAQNPSTQYMTSSLINRLKAIKNVKSVDLMYVWTNPTTISYNHESGRLSQLRTWSNLMQTSSLDVGTRPGKNEIVLQESDIQKINPTAFDNKDWKSMLGKEITLTSTYVQDGQPKELTKTLKVSGVIQDIPGGGSTMLSFDTLQAMIDENQIDTQPMFAIVTVNHTRNVKQVTNDVESLKTDDNKLAFATQGVGSILDTITNITGIVSTVLAAVAGISLIVSIFMIVVTTYMSVAERTKEIGIIRALGGRRIDISLLFVAESVILGFFASVIAVLVAFLAQTGINKGLHHLVGGNLVQITGGHILFAVLMAIIIALLASFAPSIRAAHLNTIDALATE